MAEEKKEDPKVYSKEDFLKEYEQLVKKTGWALTTAPVFVKTNHNTYELTVQNGLEKLPEGQQVVIS